MVRKFTVTCADDLVERLDAAIIKGMWLNRGDAVRQLLASRLDRIDEEEAKEEERSFLVR